VIELRDYQTRQVNDTYAHWSNGVRNVLIVLPTGGGKSVEVSKITQDIDAMKSPGVVIAHRQELVGQMSLHVARGGVRHRIIAPKNVVSSIVADHRREFGRSFVDPSARMSVGGVDTLISRAEELKPWAIQQRHWVIDEAHHVLRSNKWGSAVTMFPNAYGLGVTATPERADGNGLGRTSDGVFDVMVTGPSMRDLITIGALTEYEIVVPKSDFDIDKLHITASGDFSQKDMREEAKRSHIVGDVVEQYIKYAYGQRGIAFATDVETANEMAASFLKSGIPAQSVSAKTPDQVRSDYIRRFRAGEIWVLVNVDLFGEGFDLPAVSVVMMARPTASLAVYLQQFGRALRPLAGKARGLIIDHVSNFKRHNFPDRPRVWSLDRRERRSKRDPDDIPLRVCMNCNHPYEGAKRRCPHCGFMPIPEGGGRSVEQVEGDLMLLDAATLQKMRDAITLEAPGSIPIPNGVPMMVAVGKTNRQIERVEAQAALQHSIGVWAARERLKGRPDEESYRRFYFATNGIDVFTAQSLPRADMDKLREIVDSWQ
jgi:DNA repair protein RadD